MRFDKKIKTAVVGLGGIGFEYDLKSKNEILTHCRSVFSHNKFELVCGIDKSAKKLKDFNRKYKVNTYKNIKNALENHKPLFVIVSVNTNNHYKVIKEIIKFNSIKYILLEKPGGKNFIEFKKIIKILKKKKILLFINYQRIFSDYFIKIADILKRRKNLDIIVRYNRGLLNNCSHYISFFNLFLKDYPNIKIISKDINFKNDTQLNFILKFKNARVFFIKNSLNKSSFSELQINTEFEQLTSVDSFGEFLFSKKLPDTQIKGYFNYGKKKKLSNAKKNFCQFLVLNKISDYIFYKKKYDYLYKNYFKTYKILDLIKSKSIN